MHRRTQNDWTPIEQVMVHGWLPHHSTLDLLPNSVWSQSWLVSTPSRNTLQKCKTSQWREKSGQWNKHASCHRFWSVWGHPPHPLKSYLCALESVAPYLNKIHILFQRKTMIYFTQILMNLYLEEESVSILVRPEIAYLAKLISDNFRSVIQSQIWNLEWPKMPRQRVSEFTQM